LNAHSSFISSFFFLTFRRPLTSTLFPYTTLFRSHLVGVYNQWTGQASPLTTTNTHTGPGSCSFSAEPSSSVTSGRRFAPGSSSIDRKSTRLNSSHVSISYAVFCLKKKKKIEQSHIGIMNKCSELESLTGYLYSHPDLRQLAQHFVDQRHQPLGGL